MVPNHQPDLIQWKTTMFPWFSVGFPLVYQTIRSGWWFEPLWKIWKSIGMINPNIWIKKNVPNHQPEMVGKLRSQLSEKRLPIVHREYIGWEYGSLRTTGWSNQQGGHEKNRANSGLLRWNFNEMSSSMDFPSDTSSILSRQGCLEVCRTKLHG